MKARVVQSNPGLSLPNQERKGGGFMKIYFSLWFRSLFGRIVAKLRFPTGVSLTKASKQLSGNHFRRFLAAETVVE